MKKGLRQIFDRTNQCITLHEVMYDENGKIINWSKEPMPLSAKNTYELQRIKNELDIAIKSPVLEVDAKNSEELKVALRNLVDDERVSLLNYLGFDNKKESIRIQNLKADNVYLEMSFNERGMQLLIRSEKHKFYSHELLSISKDHSSMLFYDIFIERSLAEKMNVDSHIQVLNWIDGDYIYSLLKSKAIQNYIHEISLKF